MKKLIVLVTIILIVAVAGCRAPGKNDPLTLLFPAQYMNERTEYNSEIFDIDDFMLTIKLPRGWQGIKAREAFELNKDILLSGVWSVHDILDEHGECAGAVGFNIYELYPGAEDKPIAIYGQIALGNGYRFDVNDSYNVINETAFGVAAVTDVYYSASINDGEEKINKGIVSYNKELQVYIAIEFAGDMITDEQLKNIADSIIISSPNNGN